jgi:hypothetical protein
MTSPFTWAKDARPSIFATDARFAANKHGRSISQEALQSTTDAKRQAVDHLAATKRSQANDQRVTRKARVR